MEYRYKTYNLFYSVVTSNDDTVNNALCKSFTYHLKRYVLTPCSLCVIILHECVYQQQSKHAAVLFLSLHRALCGLFNYTHQHMHIYIYYLRILKCTLKQTLLHVSITRSSSGSIHCSLPNLCFKKSKIYIKTFKILLF